MLEFSRTTCRKSNRLLGELFRYDWTIFERRRPRWDVFSSVLSVFIWLKLFASRLISIGLFFISWTISPARSGILPLHSAFWGEKSLDKRLRFLGLKSSEVDFKSFCPSLRYPLVLTFSPKVTLLKLGVNTACPSIGSFSGTGILLLGTGPRRFFRLRVGFAAGAFGAHVSAHDEALEVEVLSVLSALLHMFRSKTIRWWSTRGKGDDLEEDRINCW